MQQPTPSVLERPISDALTPAIEQRLANGKLIIVLDAILKTGSVTLAAKRLGMQTSAVSRILGQLREQLNDPIVIRSGRGLVPTPFAEKMQAVVAAVVEGIEAVFQGGAADSFREPPFDESWNVQNLRVLPGFATSRANLIDGEPSARDFDAKLSKIGEEAHPQDRLAKALAIISTTAGHRRPLSQNEAKEAIAIILEGNADPVQIGAFMAILQLRNITASELAGFVSAVREHVDDRFGATHLRADLDWPCYISPNQQNPPWFMLAALLVAKAGHKVVLHGASGAGDRSGRHEFVASALGIPVCHSAEDVSGALTEKSIAYVPLSAFAPQVYHLMGLHRLTGHRSPIRNAMHLVSPVRAEATVLGVAQSGYKDMHRETAIALGLKNLAILGNTRDVAQFTPFKATAISRLVNGEAIDTRVPRIREPVSLSRPRTTKIEYWCGVWRGAVVEERIEKIVISTAATALLTLAREPCSSYDAAYSEAARIWKSRHTT